MASLIYQDDIKIFDLGRLILGAGHNRLRRRAFLVYEKHVDPENPFGERGQYAMIELVGFYSDRKSIVNSHQEPRFHNHPHLSIGKHLLTAGRGVRVNGQIERFVMVPPVLQTKSDGSVMYSFEKFDLSGWDPNIVEKIGSLPEYVREVMAIK